MKTARLMLPLALLLTFALLPVGTSATASEHSFNSQASAKSQNTVQDSDVDFQVRGYTSSGSGARSPVSSKSEKNIAVVSAQRVKAGAPGPVKKMKIPTKKIKRKKATIKWKRPKVTGKSKVKAFQVRHKVVGKKWKRWKTLKLKKVKRGGKQRFTYKRKKLKPGTTYKVQLRAKNSVGPGKKKSRKLTTRGGSSVKSWSYSYNVNDPQYLDANGNGANAKDFWFSQDGGLLEEIETTQFVDEVPDYFTVEGPNGTQCFSVFDGTGSKDFTTVRADGSDPIRLKAPNPNEPQHLTLIPWWSKSNSCNIETDLKAYDESVVLAIFVSATYWSNPPENARVCRISPADAQAINEMYWNSNGTEGWTSADGQCVIDKPQVRGDLYTGTLWTMLSEKTTRPLYIELEAGATLTAPLNGKVIQTSDPNGYGDYCLLAPERQIIVTGFGRLDGREVNKRYQDRFEGAGKPAHYAIDSGQLFLASRAKSGFGIDVSGITAANGAVRNETSVGLNDGNHWHCGPDGRPESGSPGYEGSPVKVWDFKRPAVWWYASDSLEVSADSEISYAYLHSADDAIKISAPRQRWENITVLQGGVGAVINIGSYGYNSGTEGTVVKGVSVPRITHTLYQDQLAGYDDRNGLIATRTCSQPNQKGEPQNITGVSVSDFTVHSLGGDTQSGVAPNSFVRPFALGIIGDTNAARQYAPFCFGRTGENTFRSVGNATIGDFTFTNFNVFQNPLRNSLIYDGNQVLGSDKTTTWKPIRFCETDGSFCSMPPMAPDQGGVKPVTFWPQGTSGAPGYYLCGVGPSGDASQCWTTSNLTGPTAAMANNVDYSDAQDRLEGGGKGYQLPANTVVFPYGG